jgi:NADP-dependent aldehyde dehydrogenase
MELSTENLDAIVESARRAGEIWRETAPRERASALVAAAAALDSASDELIEIAGAETGLTRTLLAAEINRTAVQLRLFAETIADGSYLEVRIDEADPQFVLGSRPDVRRYLTPLGPVLNFAASNFPFAFSVAGGDTASALAAGCAVVVKAHPGHPRLSTRTTEVVSKALEDASAPVGLLQLISGEAAGLAMLNHTGIAASSFTGSQRVGQLLAQVAAQRPVPIPFFGELGSVNPVYVTPAAVAEAGETIASGFVASVAGSAGQLCTKPGFLFLPLGHALDKHLATAAQSYEEHRLLNPGIARGFAERRRAILETAHVSMVSPGSFRFDREEQGWATPTIVKVSTTTLVAERESLLDEAFGPLSIIVEYDDVSQLVALSDELFAGNLTGTIHAATEERGPAVAALIDWLSKHSGRVLFGGWPTGVAVTPAMQHGGPWPATTNDSSTSVRTASMSRFLRAVAYQDMPSVLLPKALRDDNPWRVPQLRSPVGESSQWGCLTSLPTP